LSDVIVVSGLCKVYDELVAVDDVSFTVREGEIFGLLGPNGAGKTTTLECMEGLRIPDSGNIDIMGVDPNRDPRKLHSIIGVQLQSSGLPQTIKVKEAMKFFSAYHGVNPRMELLARLNLSEKAESEYQTLSTGQQRRLALALAISHSPAVLFLDEPTAGLDVASRVELHCLMNELKEAGTTIILSTHDMAEAEEMTDRVAILLQGRIVTISTPRELTATGSGLTKISLRTSDNTATGVEFPAVEKQTFGEEYNIYYSRDIGPTVTAIIYYIVKNNDTLIDLRVERPSLEERFLELTKEGAV